MTGETGNAETQSESLSAREVWLDIIQGHPELTRVGYVSYPVQEHGGNDFFHKESRVVIPSRSPEADLFPGKTLLQVNELIAINSVVDTCNSGGCSHSKDEHMTFYWNFLEKYYDGLYPPFEHPQSFIFLDLESPYEGVPERTISALSELEENIYILASGGGYHGIIDKLVSPENVPYHTGEVLCLLGEEFKSLDLLGYGKDLMKNGHDLNKLKRWCEDVVDNVGHMGDSERKSYVVDLRYYSHSMERLIEFLNYLHDPRLKERPDIYESHNYGIFYLRISNRPGKYEKPPYLVAKRVKGKVGFLSCEKLNKTQPYLFSESENGEN
jgi:hypothetical protein